MSKPAKDIAPVANESKPAKDIEITIDYPLSSGGSKASGKVIRQWMNSHRDASAINVKVSGKRDDFFSNRTEFESLCEKAIIGKPKKPEGGKAQGYEKVEVKFSYVKLKPVDKNSAV